VTELDATNQCRRMLLEAGADPTVAAQPEHRSYLRNITTQGTFVSYFLIPFYRRVVLESSGLSLSSD